MLDNVLNKNIDRKGTLCSIQLGTNNIEYDDKFNLFLITKNPNPHYTPETLNKVTLINFTIT
jgi:dynein heavy chain